MADPMVLLAAQPLVVTRAGAALLSALLLGGFVVAAHLIISGSADDAAFRAERERRGVPPSELQALERRRGVKSLVMGEDGRASTSKAQVVLWTFAVLYALLFLLLWGRSSGCGATEPVGALCQQAAVGRGALQTLAEGALQHEYYALLGLPVAAAVAAKRATTGKLEEGSLRKRSIAEDQGGLRDTLSEIVSTDDGRTDLLDFQYFAFTLVALGYFLIEFLSAPAAGLPDLPPTLVALSGVTAGAYVAKKALEGGGDEEPPAPDVPDARARKPRATPGAKGSG